MLSREVARQIIYALYGPLNWRTRASRAFGLTMGSFKLVLGGRRALTLRALLRLEAAAHSVDQRLRIEEQAEVERIHREYAAHRIAAQAAGEEVKRELERRREERRRS